MKKIILSCLIAGAAWIHAHSQDFIAHRGASYLAPENTVAAAKLAWELGADAVEIDIHLSSDKRTMVHHDHSTKRQTGVDLKIKETSSEELRKLDAGSFKDEKYKGEKIPFLEEILETVPKGKTLVVEIKCESDILPYLKQVIQASGKKKQVTFIAFNWETIVKTKALFPKNDCYWLSSSRETIDSKIEEAASAKIGLDLGYGAIDKALMERAKELKIDVLCWTVDQPDTARKMKELGVSGITTNRPAWLKQQLESELGQ